VLNAPDSNSNAQNKIIVRAAPAPISKSRAIISSVAIIFSLPARWACRSVPVGGSRRDTWQSLDIKLNGLRVLATIGRSNIEDERPEARTYDNSGILFRNTDKTNERDRDYKGEATIDGVGYWMSGWIKEGKKGKFMTFSFKPKDAPKDAVKKSRAADFNAEIPF
jgi:hypothetical protein